jgi:hypothetical protein
MQPADAVHEAAGEDARVAARLGVELGRACGGSRAARRSPRPPCTRASAARARRGGRPAAAVRARVGQHA